MKNYNFKINLSVMDFTKTIQDFELTIGGNSMRTARKSVDGVVKNIPGQRTSVSEFGSKVFFSIEEIDYGIMKPC